MFAFLVRDFRDLQKLQRTPCKMCRNTGFFELRGNARQRNPYSGIFLRSQNNRYYSVSAKVTDQKITKKSQFCIARTAQICSEKMRSVSFEQHFCIRVSILNILDNNEPNARRPFYTPRAVSMFRGSKEIG